MTDEEIIETLTAMTPDEAQRLMGISPRGRYNIIQGKCAPSPKTRAKIAAWVAGKRLPQTLDEVKEIEAKAFAAGVASVKGGRK